jgi:hypothetical protein
MPALNITYPSANAQVVTGTAGEIIVDIHQTNVFNVLNSVEVSIAAKTNPAAVFWRGSGSFKDGLATFKLTYPPTGSYVITARCLSVWGSCNSEVRQPLTVVDDPAPKVF